MTPKTEKQKLAWNNMLNTLSKILDGSIKTPAMIYTSQAQNIATGNPFSGFNKATATIISFEKADNRFISYKEATARGWSVKGAKAVPFYRPIIKEDPETGEKSRNGYTAYSMFNLGDIKHDLTSPEQGDFPLEDAIYKNGLKAVESVSELTRQPVSAHVSVSKNSVNINIPPLQLYTDYKGIISSIFHELAHAVGKQEKTFIEYEKYRGIEELIAESTALLCMAEVGVPYLPKNASYIASWLGHAKETHENPLDESLRQAIKRVPKVLAIYDKANKTH